MYGDFSRKMSSRQEEMLQLRAKIMELCNSINKDSNSGHVFYDRIFSKKP
jgi:hypothetical protein